MFEALCCEAMLKYDPFSGTMNLNIRRHIVMRTQRGHQSLDKHHACIHVSEDLWYWEQLLA